MGNVWDFLERLNTGALRPLVHEGTDFLDDFCRSSGAPFCNRLTVSRPACFSLSFAFEYPAVKYIPFFLERSSLEGLGFFALGIWCRRFIAPEDIAGQLQHRLLSFISLKLLLAIALVFSIPWGMEALPGLIYKMFLIVVLFCTGIAVMKHIPRLGGWLARFGEAVFFVYIMQELLILFFCARCSRPIPSLRLMLMRLFRLRRWPRLSFFSFSSRRCFPL